MDKMIRWGWNDIVRRLGVIIFFLCCLVISSVCFSEERKEEWNDKTYDFKQIKTIVVQYTFGKDVTVTDVEKQKVENILRAIFKDSSVKPKYLYMQQAEDQVEKESGLNLKEIKVSDKEQYDKVMQNVLPAVADAILQVTITQQGYTIRHIPGGTEFYTEYEVRYEQVPYTNSWGQTSYVTRTYQVPVQRIRAVPPYDVNDAHAGVEFVLLSSEGRQAIWKSVDIREAVSKDVLGMTERIFNRAKDKLKDLITK